MNAAANRPFHALGVWILHALQRHQDKRRVVHIGVKIIAKFKRPAAGFGVFVLDLPIAGAENLLREHPVRSLHERGMIRGQASFFQRDHGDASVPDRRNARLHANGVAVFDFKARKFLDFPPSKRIVRAVPQGHQGENRIHHRRIDSGEALGAFDVVQHPVLGFAKGAPAQRFPHYLR